jgi:hypothetical protein
MKRVERPVGQHQLRFALRDQSEAVAAGIRHSLGDPLQRGLTVRVAAATPDPIDLFARNASNHESHDSSSSAQQGNGAGAFRTSQPGAGS